MKSKENVTANRSHSVLHAKLAPACFATMLALGMVIPVHAAVIADGSSASQPSIHTGANGATVVDINKASAGGVSHNIYTEFNVDANGVVLNNSGSAVNTQLAGQVDGNANLAGGSAKIILNEVRSSDPSQLNGMVEVAGQSAQVIIANPSGITCDGCGFINTNHATLTTGTATFDSKGNVNGLDVKKGQVVITGKGMDTTATQYTDIFARSVKVNAQLKANELNIITGSNHIDKNGRASYIAGTSAAPAMALDVSSLGSMYANKIYMKGTEKGVGVNLDHADLSAADSLVMDVNGNIINNGGNVYAKNNLQLQAQRDVQNRNGQIGSDGQILVSAQNMVDNTHGTIAGKGTVQVDGNINNASGTISAGKDVEIFADTYSSDTRSSVKSGGNMDLTVQGDFLNYGTIDSGKALSLTLGSNGYHNSYGNAVNGGTIKSAGNMVIQKYNSVFENYGTIAADQLDLQVTDLYNNGVISSRGDMNISAGNLRNQGTAQINAGKNLNAFVSSLTTDKNTSISAGNDVYMDFQGNGTNAGEIKAGHNLTIAMNSSGSKHYSLNNNGVLSAGDTVNLQLTRSSLSNAGEIKAEKAVLVSANSIYNNGKITSTGDVNLSSDNSINNDVRGEIVGNKVMTSGKVYNSGTIKETGSQVPDNTTPDNGNVTPDNGNVTPDNGNVKPDNGGSSADNNVHPNGPDDQGGIWVDGVDYVMGSMAGDVYVKSVSYGKDGSYTIKTDQGVIKGHF